MNRRNVFKLIFSQVTSSFTEVCLRHRVQEEGMACRTKSGPSKGCNSVSMSRIEEHTGTATR